MQLRLPAAAGAQEAASPTADLCLLTPEQTAGLYDLPLNLLRRDITEGKPGLPLRLRIAVADVNSCAPLENAAVDIWHCDAQGFYSGVAGEPCAGASQEAGAGAEVGTFLRGIQLTDADGIAEFETIYPGWYSGRAVHIHMKIHIVGAPEILEQPTPAEETGTYEGGHGAHTGQLYFDDAVSDEIYAASDAYAGRDQARRIRNEQDGVLGEITIGVDPEATPGPAGFGGGPPPGAPPPEGSPPGNDASA